MIQHRHLQHRNRPSAGGSRVLSESPQDAAEEPLSNSRLSSSLPSGRRGPSLSGNTEQSSHGARISRLDSNRLLAPKWIMDSLEKVDVNELDESDRGKLKVQEGYLLVCSCLYSQVIKVQPLT